MATQAEIMELYRQDEMLRVRQMRNARARTIGCIFIATVAALFVILRAVLAWTQPMSPPYSSSGWALICLIMAVAGVSERRRWIALRNMMQNPDSEVHTPD